MVLTVKQFQLLLEQPKKDAHLHKLRMEFLLNTGMRYAEARRFVFADHGYNARKIHKPKTGNTYKQAERWIHLLPQYNERLKSVQEFLKLKDKDGLGFPTLSGFQKNLERWFEKAGIKSHDLVKIFRKTRECWLVVSKYDSALVAMDQGHTQTIQLIHYLNNPFGADDIQEIKEYTKGWM